MVSQVEQEDALLISGIEGYLDEYIKAGVKETLGIDFKTWMTYPYCKQKIMLDAVIRHGSAKNDITGQKLNAIEAAMMKQLTGGGS